MVHPHPADAMRQAFFAWLIDKPYTPEALPNPVRAFEQYKVDTSTGVPPVPFQMLTALPLKSQDWAQIALQSGWHMVRMNLNTFTRHGVFDITGMDRQIATKLKDPAAIRAARVFPYQLLVAYKTAGNGVPPVVRNALREALELALENVPTIPCQIVVCPDVSGSMSSPVTGYRQDSTTSVRCVDVAALIAAAFLRKNPKTMILPFEHRVRELPLNSRDTVMTNAEKLAAIGGGGTNCSAPLVMLNDRKVKADLVIFVSDNESWVDARKQGASEMMRQWGTFKRNNPRAKLVCLDIQPNGTTQAAEREDILNVGGFSDEVFTIMGRFTRGDLAPEHWVSVIEGVEL